MGVLEDLKSTIGMGARANKYRILMASSGGYNIDDKGLDVLCKGGAIPAKTIGQIEVWNQGRKLPIAGDSTFENTWTLTFWNTQDLKLRKDFENWLDFIDNFNEHKRDVTDHASYMTDGATIQQLDTRDNSTVLASYKFSNLWPTGISAIDMADESVDTITEFTVDFSYSHWVRIT